MAVRFSDGRKQLGLTQEQLAEVMNVSVVTIRRVEQSKTEPKTLYVLAMEGLLARKRSLLGMR